MPQVLHNALRRITALQRAYRNALGANDDPAFKGVERAGETMQPVLDLWGQPEWNFLRDDRLFWVNPSQAAVAGQFQQVGIRNPTGSGSIMVVEWVRAFDPTLTGNRLYELRIRAQGTAAGTSTAVGRDTRLPDFVNGISNAVSLTNTAAARVGTLVASGVHPAQVHIDFPFKAVLTPGFELWVGASSANIGVQATFVGRVRTALPGEL